MTASARAFSLVKAFFGGDGDKTMLWMRTPNPLLGDRSPRDMIVNGRSDKLLKFVEQALAENGPPEGDPC